MLEVRNKKNFQTRHLGKGVPFSDGIWGLVLDSMNIWSVHHYINSRSHKTRITLSTQTSQNSSTVIGYNIINGHKPKARGFVKPTVNNCFEQTILLSLQPILMFW